jgi:hypothetical protein
MIIGGEAIAARRGGNCFCRSEDPVFGIARAAVGPDAQGQMEQWYYGENGQHIGPVTEADLGALVASGRITPATLVWRDGMPGWLTFSQLHSQGGAYPGQLPQYMGYNMMNPTTSGYAIASLVCGIVGLVTCFVFIGIPAVICGHVAMHQIANARSMVVGRGMAIAGLVLGYLCLLILLSFGGLIIFSIANHP